VDVWWKTCESFVGDQQIAGISTRRCDYCHRLVQIRTAFRLRAIRGVRHNHPSAVTPVSSSSSFVRYRETINGRTYVIEASAVGRDRWRAQIARLPGSRAALMPFYGATADEAASHLTGWLTRASRAR
jgi:hypothetical protein